MKVLFTESEWWDKFSDGFKDRYRAAIEAAYTDVSKLLDGLPKHVNFLVDLAPWNCMEETGDGGHTWSSRLIILSLDQGLPYGEQALIDNVRAMVFHELNHSLRFEKGIRHKSSLDSCIMEGLATVFERDYAEGKPLWGKNDPIDAKAWLKEIQEQGDAINHGEYMYKHPDGRKWIGYKVGTYIVDEAMKHSGKNVIELSILDCAEILTLAKVLD